MQFWHNLNKNSKILLATLTQFERVFYEIRKRALNTSGTELTQFSDKFLVIRIRIKKCFDASLTWLGSVFYVICKCSQATEIDLDLIM